MKKNRIYLDNNGTTQVDPQVIEVIVDDLKSHFGNPSSTHSFGQDSRKRLTKARDVIAEYLSVKPQELIFTSSGTEAINMVIKGLFENKPGGHILTSAVEHSSVYSTVKAMETKGCTATFLSPGLWGAVTVSDVEAALKPDTRLIILMAVNNETGVKTNIEAIAALALERRIPFVVDAVALLGKESFSIPSGVSAMCFSGHKLHAPKGIGLLWLRSGLKIKPLMDGGQQEQGRRGGTENISGIMAFSEAVHLLKSELPEASKRMQILRDKFEKTLLEKIPNVTVNGQGPRVVNTSNLAFAGIEGETLLAALDLDGLAVSHGSACSSGALEPSRILLNMGISMEMASSSLRFSLSRFTTEDEIDVALEIVIRNVGRLRRSSQ
jgi:cysteine desulfurase